MTVSVVVVPLYGAAVYLYPLIMSNALIALRKVEIPPIGPTSKFLSTVKSLNENVPIPAVGAPVKPTYL